ncbi:MAG: hypothetical protein ACXADB_08080 [Candidatus Hermodarchaeia archaeon]|jgi:hypothetical protein
MSNETAGTLALIGGIFNLMGGLLLTIVFFFLAFLLVGVGVTASAFTLTLFLVFVTIGALSMLLGILPIMWRNDPGNHRVGLILIGAITIPSLGGILNLVAGLIATNKEVT